VTWRVEVTRSAVADGVAIEIAHRSGNVVERLHFTRQTEVVEPYAAAPVPSLVVDDGLGRALLDALADHYGNTSGGRQQRADFEHERRRVDKLTDRLLGLLDGGNWQRGRADAGAGS
jgi:hypothetical protein